MTTTAGNEFKKTAFKFALCFLAGMYLVFVLAIFIPFPKGYFLQAVGMALLLAVFSLFNGTILLGAVIAAVLGMLCAKWFLSIKNRLPVLAEKKIRRIKLVFYSGLLILGVFSLVPVYHFVARLTSPNEQIWDVDTDGDGKTDKWVHIDRSEKLCEIDYDTDGDGKPDLFEYYDKQGKLEQRTREILKK